MSENMLERMTLNSKGGGYMVRGVLVPSLVLSLYVFPFFLIWLGSDMLSGWESGFGLECLLREGGCKVDDQSVVSSWSSLWRVH